MQRDESFGEPNAQSPSEDQKERSLKQDFLAYGAYLLGFWVLTVGLAFLINDEFGHKISALGIVSMVFVATPAVKMFSKWWVWLPTGIVAIAINESLTVLAWMYITDKGAIDYSGTIGFVSVLMIFWIFCAAEISAEIVRKFTGAPLEVFVKGVINPSYESSH